jgi:hypothetical protein
MEEIFLSSSANLASQELWKLSGLEADLVKLANLLYPLNN